MASQDLHNEIQCLRALSPVSVADDTAQVSQIIDTAGYEAVEFVILTGSIADANATFTVLVEDSDASDFTGGAAVSDTFLLGTEASAGFQYDDDNQTRKIGYVGDKRYVRLTITPSGNGSAALLAAVAVLSCPRQAPTDTQAY